MLIKLNGYIKRTVIVQGENVRDKEVAYLDGLLKQYAYWQTHYTPLAGIAEVRKAVEDGPRLDLPVPFIPREFEALVEHGFGPRTEVHREPVDDLRAAIGKHRRMILLGDPGSGKTTLWQLTHAYAQAAREDVRAPLPVYVRLGGYTTEEPFARHLARHLGPLAPYLDSYRAAGRLILLLDWLNEMPQAGYADRVSRIQAALDRHADGIVVVTCRPLDYVAALKGLQKIEVAPLDGPRIRLFLQNFLGKEAGERLFWRLAGGEVEAVWDVWRSVDQTWDAFWNAERMPQEVYARTTGAQDHVWRGLREHYPPLLAMGRNPYLLLMTAQVYAGAGELPANRAQMFGAFVTTLLRREQARHPARWVARERLEAALAALAYAMQVAGERGTTVARAWAEERLAQAVPDCDPERILYLTTSATLLDGDDVSVRFYHQLLQEYFAAREMQRRAEAGEDLARYWPPDQWWEPSGWEETAILMAGMAGEAGSLVQRLAAVNPVVAGRCLAEGDPQVDGEARDCVADTLIPAMRNNEAPPRTRAVAGDLLAKVGDPRFRADAWYLPDEPLLGFVAIPAGPFAMGSAEDDEEAYGNEKPQHTVNLPTYYIARYPVTVAQYRVFVEETGYEVDDRALQGLANHPVRYLNWEDAVAYGRWLTETLRAWEGTPAPRGVEGRRYPWGDDPNPNRANYRDTGIRTTSAVGCFSEECGKSQEAILGEKKPKNGVR